MTPQDLEAILNGSHGDPFSRARTASNRGTAGRCARSFRRPWTPRCIVRRHCASHAQNALRGILRGRARRPIRRTTSCSSRSGTDRTRMIDDPYRFPPLLSDFDLHLHGEGTQYESYRTMGAHLVECEGVHGVRFAVWAPNAEVVSVVGDFNDWDERRHPMRAAHRRRLGDLPAGRRRRAPITSIPCVRPRAAIASRRPILTDSRWKCRRNRPPSCAISTPINGTTSSGWTRARTKII